MNLHNLDSAVTPLPQQVRTLDVGDGMRLALNQTGDSAAALTVLYVHGLLSGTDFWGPLTELLHPQIGSRATQLAFDARGHGRSGWPHRRAKTDFSVLADDLAHVVDSIRGPIVLVAHGIGSFVVLEHARRHPRQVHARLAEVVLFAAAGEEYEGEALRAFKPAAAGVRWMRHRGLLDNVNAAGHRYLSQRLCTLATHAKPGLAQLIPSQSPVDPRVTADLCTHCTTYRLHETTVRTLATSRVRLITAEFDTLVPATQPQQLADRLPGARVEHVAGAGHSLPLTNPQLAAPAILSAVNRLARPIPAAAGSQR
ncbi:alpha/beta fold hydrolase [Nocardia suismassiliense]|uniref:alpha/beta fold hydrolase n=1 Tax=Nocardia suismassiliense TaxID=2077092 RepID=UPI000D1EB421|nr:alpha/beta hydrolase [Nocardia suismassiliense]